MILAETINNWSHALAYFAGAAGGILVIYVVDRVAAWRQQV